VDGRVRGAAADLRRTPMLTLIRATWLLSGDEPIAHRDGAVLIDGSRIAAVGHADATSNLPVPSAGVRELRFANATILPGLIDCHAHLTFALAGRSYEDFMECETDDMMLLRGVQNSGAHLAAGVTTVRDCGARNNVAQRLRELSSTGLFDAPRILVAGAPITPSRGHFWFCNGEADGRDGVRRRARALLDENVDCLKVMASGGGTAGTDSRRAAYGVEEIAVAVEEAHSVGKRVVAHCLAAESVDVALDAGVDSIEHINFIHPDGSRRMSDATANRIVDQGVFVTPTLQTGFRRLESLRSRAGLTNDEVREMAELELKLGTKLEFVRRLHQLGARIVAGTDAVDDFGDYALGLELLTTAGMTPAEAIGAATQGAAEAVGLGDSIGSLAPGRIADLIVVDGDAAADLSGLRKPRLVVRGGRIVAGGPALGEVAQN
jgi:imidazolonepropionase-like amidohydrolase